MLETLETALDNKKAPLVGAFLLSFAFVIAAVIGSESSGAVVLNQEALFGLAICADGSAECGWLCVVTLVTRIA